MDLQPGAKLGPYELVAAIGKGGMGEVWRARDPQLGRDVAIKFSAQQFSDRFEREARAIAALNHANVCTLYHVGPNYLVMEYIEGPTLAERLKDSPIPLDEALGIARQIADALEAAHEKNIVHRDLKPANVKIRPDGSVKVLDFGLAKSGGTQEVTPDSPTMMPGTQIGMILGTAGYMSPEQARAKEVDKRADIWAFGVVLYEMVTGKRLFEGETVSDTLAAVLKEEPDLTLAPEKTRRLLRACLEKDPKRRLRDIGDMGRLLEESERPATDSLRSRLSSAGLVAAGVFALIAAALAFVHFREKPPEAQVVRFQIGSPASEITMLFPILGVSPDGRKVVFGAFGTLPSAQGSLWIRSLDTQEARRLIAGNPLSGFSGFIWSTDSRFLVFGSADKLNKIDVTGGPPQALCDLPPGDFVTGGFWTRDNKIVFGSRDGLRQVSAAGGASVALTTVDRSKGETRHGFPSLLPDGRHFLYMRVSTQEGNSGTYVGTLDTKPEQHSAKKLLDVSEAAYVQGPGGSGYLLFLRTAASPQGGRPRDTLMAQPFDARNLELAGEAVPVADQVNTFAVSAAGVLVYQAGFVNGAPVITPTWFDRHGTDLGTAAEPGRYLGVALSPDATRLAGARAEPQSDDIWLYELSSGKKTRFTFGPGQSVFPVWSPDGSRILFTRSGAGLFQRASNLAGEEGLLFKGFRTIPTSWSPDGRFALFDAPNTDPKKQNDVLVLPLDSPESGAHAPIAIVAGDFNESAAKFSPDGKWIAYSSDQSGREEIYVRPFDPASPGKPSSEGLHMVSNGGGISRLGLGIDAFWRGRELFYTAPDGSVMAVEVTTSPAFKAGAAQPVFKLPALATLGDVTSDGKRFLVLVPAGGDTPQAAPYSVVVNWPAILKK